MEGWLEYVNDYLKNLLNAFKKPQWILAVANCAFLFT